MPAGGPQRIISLFEQDFAGTIFYTLAPGELLQIETVTWVCSIEPPLILYGTVTYGDPAAGVFGTFSTPPFIANRPAVATSVRFSFGRGLDSDPVGTPIFGTVDEGESLYDMPLVQCSLPDVPLADGQSVSIEAVAFNPDATGADIHLEQIVIVATDLNDGAEGGVIPPYTALPFSEQVSPLAQAVA